MEFGSLFLCRVRASVRQRMRRAIWRLRYQIRRFREMTGGSHPGQRDSHFSQRIGRETDRALPQVIFINLDSRKDRLEETNQELTRMGFSSIERLCAYKENNGALGCALSHVAALEKVGKKNELVLVCEDDVEFIVDTEKLQATLDDFMGDPSLDILCLAYNIYVTPRKVSRLLGITNDTTGTACYIVKPHAVSEVVEVFQESARLLASGAPRETAAIDVLWKRLQQGRLFFSVPLERVARQRTSYSDIERRHTNYGV